MRSAPQTRTRTGDDPLLQVGSILPGCTTTCSPYQPCIIPSRGRLEKELHELLIVSTIRNAPLHQQSACQP